MKQKKIEKDQQPQEATYGLSEQNTPRDYYKHI